MRKLLISAAFFAFQALALLTVSHAAPSEAYCSKPVRVAMFEFGILYRAETSDGMDVRILAELAKRSVGCGSTLSRINWEVGTGLVGQEGLREMDSRGFRSPTTGGSGWVGLSIRSKR